MAGWFGGSINTITDEHIDGSIDDVFIDGNQRPSDGFLADFRKMDGRTDGWMDG